MPALGESVTEGTVTRWLKNVGDQVEVDEPLLEVSTDKVDTEIPSPFAGVLEQILVQEDETVEVGAQLAVIGSVGLTEAKAKELHGADNVEVLEYNLGGNGKSQILATAGFIKLVRQKDGPVVGVHMIGARVGELIGEGQLIVNWEAYPEDVAALVHAHPTQNEALGEAHLALAGKPLHAHN